MCRAVHARLASPGAPGSAVVASVTRCVRRLPSSALGKRETGGARVQWTVRLSQRVRAELLAGEIGAMHINVQGVGVGHMLLDGPTLRGRRLSILGQSER